MANVLVDETSLQNIASAIRLKNGSSDTYKPSEMSTAIENIPSGGDLSDYFNKGTSSMSTSTDNQGYTQLIKKIGDTITSFPAICSGYFYRCRATEIVIDKNIDTSNITNMVNMFAECTNISSLDLSGFDTSNVTLMNSTFRLCSSLLRLDLSGFDTSNVTGMVGLFQGCIFLNFLDIRNFDFSNVTNYTNMFGYSTNDGPPDNCLIIVKDATQKQWLNTKFSRLTNVKTVAEYEGS